MIPSSSPRIISELWVHALLRQCQSVGLMAFQLARGDKERGSVIIKVSDLSGKAYCLQQSLDFDGNRIWRRSPVSGPGDEKDIDQKIQKERGFDPDIWVIEIEDPNSLYDHSEPIEAL